MSSAHYSPPDGPPPPPSTRPVPQIPPQHQDSLDGIIPDEPPPAYSVVSTDGHTTIAAGPSRPDFSGPPPMPDRLQQQQHPSNISPTHLQAPSQHHLQQTPTGGYVLPGVGVGYGQQTQTSQNVYGAGSSSSSSHFGSSQPNLGYHPPPPPRHPSATGYAPPPPPNLLHSPPPPPPLGSHSKTSAPLPSSDPPDVTPTEAPVPGRPLLHRGQLLVYPKNHWCSKCNNTGYIAADPSHPCSNDWRKYGKPYNSVLAHSYTLAPAPGSNPSTVASTNFQRPLPNLSPAGPGPSAGPSLYHPQPQANPYGHLPPPPQQGHPGFGPPPVQGGQLFVQHTPRPAPPGALVVRPGDPRIGGRLCYRCGGSGREFSLFAFDDVQCLDCRGLGRLF